MTLCALCLGTMNRRYPDDVQCNHGDRATRATLWLAIGDPRAWYPDQQLELVHGYAPAPLVMVDAGDVWCNRDYIAFNRAEKPWADGVGVKRLSAGYPDDRYVHRFAPFYGWNCDPPEVIVEGYVYSVNPRELVVRKNISDGLNEYMAKACVE